MQENTLIAAERQLANRGVKITFFKALILLEAIENRYPSGLEGFIEHYRSITPGDGLIGVTFHNEAALAEFVSTMADYNILEGEHIATANQLHGELVSCSGISFVTVSRQARPDANRAFPVWYACAGPSAGLKH